MSDQVSQVDTRILRQRHISASDIWRYRLEAQTSIRQSALTLHRHILTVNSCVSIQFSLMHWSPTFLLPAPFEMKMKIMHLIPTQLICSAANYYTLSIPNLQHNLVFQNSQDRITKKAIYNRLVFKSSLAHKTNSWDFERGLHPLRLLPACQTYMPNLTHFLSEMEVTTATQRR